MGRLTPEIEELVDQFCEGSLSAEQAGRLEALVGESDEWRQYLLESFQVHCELAWEFRRLREDSSQPAASGKIPGPDNSQRKRRRAWTYAAVAAALLVVALGLTAVFRSGRQENPLPSSPAAGIAQVSDVRGSDEKAPALHSFLPAGSTVAIQRGLLEMRLDGGVRMILQGPAEVELQSPAAAALRGGSLTVEVSPESRGFAVHTLNCTITDLGTRFGVACQPGQTEVEVFAGSVLLRLAGTEADAAREQRLLAESAVRVRGVPGQETVKTEAIASGSRHYVQSLAGSAAMLQALAGSDPHLIHHYPFEGATDRERLRDRRGNLDLFEVTMRDGDGGGRLAFARSGPDPSTHVVLPFRGEASGTTRGRGLQSQAVFQPPAAMTVELLLYLSAVGKGQEGFVASAVSTRRDRHQCGFLLAAVDSGKLACLLDGGSEWLQSGFKLMPGRWYYVASTFLVKNTDTEVNAWVADLSDKSPALKWTVRNRVVPGVPAAGRLGIGKGFDGEMASAYPWSGQLGHVAIYDTILERQTLEEHLRALTPAAISN